MRTKKDKRATDGLWALANGPHELTNYYNGCIANEVRFHTKDHEAGRTTQNSGVAVQGVLPDGEMEYLGYLDGIIELVYLGGRKVVVFSCQWFDTSTRTGNRRTVQEDKYFTSIDIRSRAYKDDPYVLPDHVQQVFYLNDTKLGVNWQVVQRVQHRHLWDLPESQVAEEPDVGRCSTQNPLQQYQSEGVSELRVEEDDDVDLVRRGVEPDEVNMEEYNKISQEKKSANVHEGSDDETEFEEKQMEDAEHFIEGEDAEMIEESDPDETDINDESDGEEEIRPRRCKKRRCKCHI